MSDAPVRGGLRSKFAWTLAGNVVHSASQWAILSLVAKLGSTELVGEYAYAMSLALPVAMMSHLNLRVVLTTDVNQQHHFGDYMAVRWRTTLIALLVTAIAAFVAAPSQMLAIATVLYGFVLAAENTSDLFYGAMQRRDRLDQISKSMIMRGVLSVAAAATVLWWTHNLLWTIAALIVARSSTLFAFDWPQGTRGEDLGQTGRASQWEILKSALPLGSVLLLISLTANLPRYAVEHSLGSRELGAFAAASSFITVGSTAMNALGQTALQRLARAYANDEVAGFRVLALKLCALAFAIGICGVLVAVFFGKTVLALLYRAELSVYQDLLIACMAAGVFVYLGIVLGYVVSSTRTFLAQSPLFALSALASGVTSWVLVPRVGLMAGPMAIAAASAMQIVGQLFLLRRRLHARGAA